MFDRIKFYSEGRLNERGRQSYTGLMSDNLLELIKRV